MAEAVAVAVAVAVAEAVDTVIQIVCFKKLKNE